MSAQTKTWRRRTCPLLLLSGIAAAGIFWLTGFFALAQTQANGTQEQDTEAAGIHVFPVQGNVYMLTGAGGNIALQTGKDGLVLVDTGRAEMADQTLPAIRTVSRDPIRFIINTNADRDHVGGNAAISKIATTISDNNFLSDIAGSSVMPGAKIVAHLAVLNRMSSPDGDRSATPGPGWPSDEYSARDKKLFLNGEAVVLYHEPAAHTDGDSIVFFRRSDVISAGDLFDVDRYPVIDLQRGGSIQGIITGLNHIIELAVPADKQEGGTYIVPGHGRLCDQADIVEYQTMLTIIRDRIQDMIGRGMTLDQVKQAKPTFDYDIHYGQTSGSWTTEMFIEAVYRSLSKK
jgi:glyoxylase-like metal-dependent hydrolase (beta-lactamase superfamily II)